MKEKVGIFRTLPKSLVKKERRAAIHHHKSLDGTSACIYANFFKLSKVERDILFALAEPKKMGRPIK
jgi:hypothetical protein